jgi:hypothetical protein
VLCGAARPLPLASKLIMLHIGSEALQTSFRHSS